MKTNFLALILDLGMKPILIHDAGPKGEDILRPLTLRDMAVTALMALPEDPKSITGPERQKRTHLADRIFGAKEAIQVTVEEASQLKTLVDAHYGQKGTLAVGRALDLLDGMEPPEEVKTLDEDATKA